MAGTMQVFWALPWNMGMAQYRTSSGREAGAGGHAQAGVGQTALAHPDRFGRARRTGREEQEVEGVGAGHLLGAGSGARDSDIGHVRRVVDDEDTLGRHPGVEVLDQRSLGAVGDEDLTVAVADVAGQLGAATRRVDPHHGGAGKGGAAEKKEKLGHVVEQDTDMERPRPSLAPQPRRPGGRLLHHLAPAPPGVAVTQTDVVVVGAGEEQLGDGGHGADDSVGSLPWGSPQHATSRWCARDFTRWLRAHRPDAPHLSLAPIKQPSTGLSSETLFLEVDWSGGSGGTGSGGTGSGGTGSGPQSLVARLPPNGDGLFPAYDLVAQGQVQQAVAAAGLPAVVPVAVELDDSWVGAPFLLMPRVAGRVVRNDKPFLRTGWLAEATAPQQAQLHAHFLDLLAGIHRIDVGAQSWDFLPGAEALRGGSSLAGEVDRWESFLAWAGEGDAPPVFADALLWCRRHLPDPEPPASLLWGDVQLGNVLVADDMTIAAVLDFEMATIGPAELDLAWFLVLHRDDGGALRRRSRRLPRPGRHRRRLPGATRSCRGRSALVRGVRRPAFSGSIMVRAARLLARLGVDDSWLTGGNPTVTLLAELIAS
jgi:aminoglycoside phosphotransferase (APT) family kinase protein